MTNPNNRLTQKLQSWSYQRQHLNRAVSDPAEALRNIIGVYSSHPTAPLALLSRSASFDTTHLGAMEQRREAIRIPAMRQSIFLVPTTIASRLFAATHQPMEKFAGNLRYAGLDWEQYAQLKQRILEHTQEPLTADALQQAIQIDAKLMTAVRLMGYEGLMLRVGSSLRTDRLLYVSTAAWLGQPLEELDAQESLTWLAQEYLRCYGPARIKDFAWWSGTTNRRATAALSTADVIDIGGGLLLPSDLQSAFESVAPIATEAIDVLPKWDSYTMGYASDGRQRLLDDQHLIHAYTNATTQGKGGTSGDGLPLLLRAGRAVATWSHRFTGNRMSVQVVPFEQGSIQPELYEHAFDEVGKLLGATSVEVGTRASIVNRA